jgi:hypothetical protein
MKFLSSAFTGLFLLFSFVAITQGFDVPATSPSTKDEFVKSEKDFIDAAKWLESTAIGKQMDKRKKMNAWVVQWMVNSPTVSMEINASISKIFDKNPDLLIVFMAGYGRYCLENSYSTDVLKGNMDGIKSAINCYNLGGDTKKDKALSKVIDADKEGKLEDWVKELMKSK